MATEFINTNKLNKEKEQIKEQLDKLDNLNTNTKKVGRPKKSDTDDDLILLQLKISKKLLDEFDANINKLSEEIGFKLSRTQAIIIAMKESIAKK